MKLSSQEEYGLRCLLRVAGGRTKGSVTIAELSRSEGISEPNVAKMMRRPAHGRASCSPPAGSPGGYALARPAAEISIGEALAALGGRLYERLLLRDAHRDGAALHQHARLSRSARSGG